MRMCVCMRVCVALLFATNDTLLSVNKRFLF